MALPEYPNQISMGDIYEEREGNTPEGDAVTNLSLSNMAYLWGQPTDPDRLSEWHGLSAWTPSWATALSNGGSSRVVFSNEGSQNHTISCYYRQDSTQSWNFGSTYSYYGSTTTHYYTSWQDYNSTTPDSFVLNGNNQLYISRSIAAFNAATIELYLYPCTFGSFNGVTYSTSNGTVTSYTQTGSYIYIKMDTSASSLTSHSLTLYFSL